MGESVTIGEVNKLNLTKWSTSCRGSTRGCLHSNQPWRLRMPGSIV